MGGQLWTETEEDYFWEEIVPNSDKKLGYTRDQRSQVKTWEQLAADMRAAMATKFRKLGKEVPRKYTALTLAEHWDKNVMQNRVSKAAKEHVAGYVGQMQATDPDRWARRQKRLSNLAGGDDGEDNEGEAKKKRKRTSGTSTTSPIPPSGPKSTPLPIRGLHKTSSKRRRTEDYDDEDDEDNEIQHHSAPSGGPSTELKAVGLPSLRNSFQASGPDTTCRQLFPSGLSANDSSSGLFGRRANPRPPPPFPVNDNPYYQPPQAQAQAQASGAGHSIETIVRDIVEERVTTAVERLRQEVARGIGALVHDEVARQMPAMARDEVARQIALQRTAPSMGRSSMAEERGSTNPRHEQHNQALFAEGLTPPPARQQHQHQQQHHHHHQQFSPVGRGGAYTSRQRPTGQFTQSPRLVDTARGTARTPLPTAPGVFPTSHVRSRVLGQSRRSEDVDEEEDD